MLLQYGQERAAARGSTASSPGSSARSSGAKKPVEKLAGMGRASSRPSTTTDLHLSGPETFLPDPDEDSSLYEQIVNFPSQFQSWREGRRMRGTRTSLMSGSVEIGDLGNKDFYGAARTSEARAAAEEQHESAEVGVAEAAMARTTDYEDQLQPLLLSEITAKPGPKNSTTLSSASRTDSPNNFADKETASQHTKKMRVPAVAALAFFSVSGGPWGVEQIFNFSPLLGLLVLAFIAVFWSWAQCQWISELSCAMPRDGGACVWVRRAFGDTMGHQMILWSRVSSSFSSAIFAVMLVDALLDICLKSVLPCDSFWFTWWGIRLLRVLIILLLAVPSLFSANTYDRILEIMAVTGMVSLLAFCVYVFGFYTGGSRFDAVAKQPVVVPTSSGILLPSTGPNPQSGEMHDRLQLLGPQHEEVVIQRASLAKRPTMMEAAAAAAANPGPDEEITMKDSSILTSSPKEPTRGFLEPPRATPEDKNQQGATQNGESSTNRPPQLTGAAPSSPNADPPADEDQTCIRPWTRGPKDWGILLDKPPEDFHWFSDGNKLLMFAYWSMSGWDNVSSVAAEIHQPEKTLPKALTIACVASWLQYAIVFSAVAIANVEPWANWGEEEDEPGEKDMIPIPQLIERIVLPGPAVGERANVEAERVLAGHEISEAAAGREEDTQQQAATDHDAKQQAGTNNTCPNRKNTAPGKSKAKHQQFATEHDVEKTPLWNFLKTLIILTMLCGYVAPYASELLASAHQVPGLVEDGMLPNWKVFSYRHPKFHTPWGGILVHTTTVIFLVVALDFSILLIFDSMFNVLPDMFGLLAFFKLRRDDPLEVVEIGEIAGDLSCRNSLVNLDGENALADDALEDCSTRKNVAGVDQDNERRALLVQIPSDAVAASVPTSPGKITNHPLAGQAQQEPGTAGVKTDNLAPQVTPSSTTKKRQYQHRATNKRTRSRSVTKKSSPNHHEKHHRTRTPTPASGDELSTTSRSPIEGETCTTQFSREDPSFAIIIQTDQPDPKCSSRAEVDAALASPMRSSCGTKASGSGASSACSPDSTCKQKETMANADAAPCDVLASNGMIPAGGAADTKHENFAQSEREEQHHIVENLTPKNYYVGAGCVNKNTTSAVVEDGKGGDLNLFQLQHPAAPSLSTSQHPAHNYTTTPDFNPFQGTHLQINRFDSRRTSLSFVQSDGCVLTNSCYGHNHLEVPRDSKEHHHYRGGTQHHHHQRHVFVGRRTGSSVRTASPDANSVKNGGKSKSRKNKKRENRDRNNATSKSRNDSFDTHSSLVSSAGVVYHRHDPDYTGNNNKEHFSPSLSSTGRQTCDVDYYKTLHVDVDGATSIRKLSALSIRSLSLSTTSSSRTPSYIHGGEIKRPFVVKSWVVYGIFPISFLLSILILFGSIFGTYIDEGKTTTMIGFFSVVTFGFAMSFGLNVIGNCVEKHAAARKVDELHGDCRGRGVGFDEEAGVLVHHYDHHAPAPAPQPVDCSDNAIFAVPPGGSSGVEKIGNGTKSSGLLLERCDEQGLASASDEQAGRAAAESEDVKPSV
ncbi:unnamed protein product [Amoebophrya sp. A120]|nr:unnamed protein product [Amoebophrya sp. A120]|eukprot:GSA120T00009584001.1